MSKSVAVEFEVSYLYLFAYFFLFHLLSFIKKSYFFKVGGSGIRIGGMEKGSGMIHPNMGTLLGVCTNIAILLIYYHKMFCKKILID